MAFIAAIIAWLSKTLNWDGHMEPLEAPETPVNAPVNVPITKPIETPMPTKTKAEILYETAVASLHKDMSPKDLAPDSLACMESVDGVWFAAFGEHLLSMPARLSTQAGYQSMLGDVRLEAIKLPVVGCIVISPTGYSNKGSQHGHTGIWGNHDVMSNDSNTGLFMDNYTHQAWYNVFQKTLGFPVYFFKPVG